MYCIASIFMQSAQRPQVLFAQFGFPVVAVFTWHCLPVLPEDVVIFDQIPQWNVEAGCPTRSGQPNKITSTEEGCLWQERQSNIEEELDYLWQFPWRYSKTKR
jgi:hypothetical protein